MTKKINVWTINLDNRLWLKNNFKNNILWPENKCMDNRFG